MSEVEDMLIQKMLDYISKHKMLDRGDTFVVAVSGGADSVALLHALWSLKDDLKTNLHVAHLNHGIRGKQSDKDAEFVSRLAERLGLPATIEKADVPALKKTLRLSTQEAARKARYEFLEAVADRIGAAKVATAHTADDQAETVLMNLIRGSGLEGLAGIPPVRERYVRPLLGVFRHEIEAYCAENGLSYRTDASNLRTDYRRNRVRLELIPLLESRYNPAVKTALANMSEILREEAAFLRERAVESFKTEAIYVEPGEVGFDIPHLLGVPIALRRRCIRMAIEAVKGDLQDVEFKQVERILARLDSGRKFTLTLPSGVIYAQREHTTLRIYRIEPEPEAPAVEMALEIPGRTQIAELGVVITAEELPTPVHFQRPIGSLDVVIDQAHIAGRLVVRNWKPGDRIQPLGMKDCKKLHDIFTDAKVPRRRRAYTPIVADDQKVIWVVGLALSDTVKITDSTTHALRLVCEPGN